MSHDKDDASSVLKLVAAAGLPGFHASEPDAGNRTAPSPPPDNDNHVDALARLVGIKPAAEQQASNPAVAPPPADRAAAQLTGPERIVLRIGDANARQALSRFEGEQGIISADFMGNPKWFGGHLNDGAEIRVFDLQGDQRAHAKAIAGSPLCGCPSLTLEVRRVDLAGLVPAGPGARERDARIGPPQLPMGAFRRLERAAGVFR